MAFYLFVHNKTMANKIVQQFGYIFALIFPLSEMLILMTFLCAPPSIASLRKKLKTYLDTKVYPPSLSTPGALCGARALMSLNTDIG